MPLLDDDDGFGLEAIVAPELLSIGVFFFLPTLMSGMDTLCCVVVGIDVLLS